MRLSLQTEMKSHIHVVRKVGVVGNIVNEGSREGTHTQIVLPIRSMDNNSAADSGSTAPAIEAVTVREALLKDHQQIAALQARYGIASRSNDDWAHLWLNNPAYVLVRDTWPLGWVLENTSGRVVGYVGNIPIFYELGGRPLTVAAGHSWVVEKEYRSYAGFLMYRYFNQRADLYLNTTVGEQAVAAFSLFGSLQVPAGAWDSCAFVITNFRGFAESVLRLRKVPAPKFISLLIAPVIFSLDRFRFKRLPPAPQAILRQVNGFDQSFDTFWAELKNNFPYVLLGDRSLAALNWHFGPALAQGNVWIITRASGNRLLAYGIFVRQDKCEVGLTRIRLADFQSLDGENTLLIPMLEWATERCRREGIHMFEVIGYEQEDKRLMALLPRRRRLPSWQYYYLAKDKKLSTLLKDAKTWHPYTFDGDATL